MQTNTEYVAALYRCLLQREPDDAGLQLYASMLNEGGCDRATLLDIIADGEEFRHLHGDGERARLRRAFRCSYGRLPDEGELRAVADVAARLRASSERDYLRAGVLAFDRYSHPTSVGVRLVERDLETVTMPNSSLSFILDRGDISVSHVLLAGDTHESHLQAVFELFVSPGMSVVDVGANVGTHTVKLAERVGAAGKVFAFEPNTENARLLSLTKARSRLANLVILPIALSSAVGSAFFSPAIGSNGGFLPDEAATILHPNCTVVPTVPMDLLLRAEPIGFIKIDVEGAEHLVLAGATEVLQRCRPVITSEFSLEMLSRVSGIAGGDYLRQMRRHGYRLYTLGLTGPVAEVEDIDAAMAGWGSFTRIEDFVFVPAEDGRGLPELLRTLDRR